MDIGNKYGALAYQQNVLAMMKDVHCFLIDAGINYSLSDGSLLGAIREKGFIPWDDDMDIMMDRQNFEKFLLVCSSFKGYVVSRMLWIYRIQRVEDFNGSLTGATIDVFVMDKVPNSALKQKFKIFFLRIIQGMMKKHRKWDRFSIFKQIPIAITYVFGKMISDSKKYKIYDMVSQIGKNDDSKYISCYNSSYRFITKAYKANLMERLILHQFEDTEFLITDEYDSYLREAYGDYMTPPPEEERKPMHK